MTSIKFTRKYGVYKIGDIAGFPANIAAQLISVGVAEPATPQPKAMPTRPSPAQKMIKK
jgi:hypothetical protein